ncbi:hypothetical protein BDW42DRAFT_48681 [Aspergillus taichungensis]|uniref:Uncharacterized protein n=1 Tax=Aspergillus taichungensis TaxID=482145 RepID=A0A2J5I2V7_9EURO|nr:hypothetical protein BDW42DRAFT_48681 [Aspergillus taichungensis]
MFCLDIALHLVGLACLLALFRMWVRRKKENKKGKQKTWFRRGGMDEYLLPRFHGRWCLGRFNPYYIPRVSVLWPLYFIECVPGRNKR